MRTAFLGLGAYVGEITGETSCGFWPVNPIIIDYDPNLLVPVDLSQTSARALAGRTVGIPWSDIQIDGIAGIDSGGLTTIGPVFPSGNMIGGVYLEETYWSELSPAFKPQWPPTQEAYDYEYKTEIYHQGDEDPPGDPRYGVRYYGFHAEVHTNTHGNLSVKVYQGGKGKSGGPTVEMPVANLASPTACDNSTANGGLTEITAVAGSVGAVFISLNVTAQLRLFSPKLPVGLGEGIKVRFSDSLFITKQHGSYASAWPVKAPTVARARSKEKAK